MSGKARADLVERRRLDILCLQETRWKENKSKDLADGHKLIYGGKTGRNVVGTVLSKNIRDSLVEVHRRCERVMSVKLNMGNTHVIVISAHAPKMGCDDAMKDQFWTEVDQEMRGAEINKKVVIGGDRNGHVGRNRGGERWHGGWSVGQRNPKGQRIIDFLTAQDMALVSTFFKKRENQLNVQEW